MVEDFIKEAYLENKIDNLQFGSISKQLNIDIGAVMKICVDLEKNGKIEFQYDIRGNAVSYTHLTLPTIIRECRSRWSPYH